MTSTSQGYKCEICGATHNYYRQRDDCCGIVKQELKELRLENEKYKNWLKIIIENTENGYKIKTTTRLAIKSYLEV